MCINFNKIHDISLKRKMSHIDENYKIIKENDYKLYSVFQVMNSFL